MISIVSMEEGEGLGCRGAKGKDLKFQSPQDYYRLLGVSPDSTSQEIKEAYRNRQKKHHPDIAGQKGHEYELKLNEAYRVLLREGLRKDYDASAGRSQRRGNAASVGYGSWRGPLTPQALFVDEYACIGCRECVHNVSKTFTMDDELGCARVKIQYGDGEQKLEILLDSCPVNCINWVDREDLAVLEFVVRPLLKDGYGVFGGGWERPSNVFVAAKAFTKEMEWQNTAEYGNVFVAAKAFTKEMERQNTAEYGYHNEFRPLPLNLTFVGAAGAAVEEEMQGKAKARMDARVKMRMERFSMV